jgi:hypothetical protein
LRLRALGERRGINTVILDRGTNGVLLPMTRKSCGMAAAMPNPAAIMAKEACI